MGTLNQQIEKMQQQIITLQTKVADMSKNLEDKAVQPFSKVGTSGNRSKNRPVEPKTGLGGTFGGNLPWNDSELKIPPLNAQPPTPTKGYNKHSHSEYSGGALDINTLKLIEYDFSGGNHNPDTQQFWTEAPPIVKYEKIPAEGQAGGEQVEAIGTLADSFVFDPNSGQFRIYAVYKETA